MGVAVFFQARVAVLGEYGFFVPEMLFEMLDQRDQRGIGGGLLLRTGQCGFNQIDGQIEQFLVFVVDVRFAAGVVIAPDQAQRSETAFRHPFFGVTVAVSDDAVAAAFFGGEQRLNHWSAVSSPLCSATPTLMVSAPTPANM